jgi:copper chaperone CopZ
MAETTQMNLKTTGMHCRSCSTLVDMTLGDLEGVEASQTDHETGDTNVRFELAAVVHHNSSPMSGSGFIFAIRQG